MTPVYGVNLGTAQVAGCLWLKTAELAGLDSKTSVHGVGDGAGWILTQFKENFGGQGSCLLDFYHVSHYLGAAATEAAGPGKENQWRRRQQGRLLNNRVTSVLRSLEKQMPSTGSTTGAVQAAHRYLAERRDHLDYAGARQHHLPIGSTLRRRTFAICPSNGTF